MIPNVNPELINQELLKNRIENLEAGYIDSLISVIQAPHFIKACEDDLATEWISPEKKKSLELALFKNKESLKGHETAIEQYNTMIPEIKSYLK